MELIYQSRYSKHEYNPQTKTMYSDWFKETENMEVSDFKTEMEEWLIAFRKKKPKYLFDRCVDFCYPLTPEEQIWMAELLYEEWIELGLKKYAHIVPEEIFSEVSVEQLFEEYFKMNFSNQFPIVNFAEKEDALKWLYSDEE